MKKERALSSRLARHSTLLSTGKGPKYKVHGTGPGGVGGTLNFSSYVGLDPASTV